MISMQVATQRKGWFQAMDLDKDLIDYQQGIQKAEEIL